MFLANGAKGKRMESSCLTGIQVSLGWRKPLRLMLMALLYLMPLGNRLKNNWELFLGALLLCVFYHSKDIKTDRVRNNCQAGM